MARSRFSSRTSKRMFYAGLAARYGASGSVPVVGDIVDDLVIDEDTGVAFPDVDVVSFADSTFIYTDSAAPENNKSSKAGFNLEDIYLCMPPDTTYPANGGWSYREDGCPGGIRHNDLNYSRDFSNAAWTKSSVTPSYLTGEVDKWGAEKVQRLTFDGGAGSSQYIKQQVSINAGIRQQQRAVFAWRCPVGETVTFVWNNAFDAEHVVKQVTGTGDWVYDHMDYLFTSSSGAPRFIIQSKAGDTADYVDIKDLQAGIAHSMRYTATNYNDTSFTNGRFYLPYEFDKDGNVLGLGFPGYNDVDALWNYSYPGLGSGSLSGGSAQVTTAILAYDALPYYNRPEGSNPSNNAPWEYWTKHTETAVDNDHYAYARATSPNQFQALSEHTADIVLKKGTRDYAYVSIRFTDADVTRVMINLNTGAITDTSHTGTKMTYNETKVRPYPNGSWWVSLSFTLVTGTTGEYMYFNVGHSDRATFTGTLTAKGYPQYTGTTSDYYYTSSPNLTPGTHFAGPVNFGGSTDNNSLVGVYRPLADLPWHATNGTIVLTFKPRRLLSGDSGVLYIGYDAQIATTTYQVKVGYDSSGNAYFRVSTNALNNQCDISSVGTVNLNQVNKIAITWGVNIFRLSLNGETAVEDTSGQISAVNSNFKQLWLGSHGGSSSANALCDALISDFLYIPQTKNANWLKNRSTV